MAPVAMVLAAGFGTRLRPLTEELPKPLVPVGDRSMLAHVCGTLRSGGVERVVLNAHHLLERYDEALLGSLGVEARIVDEARILGTAGGVHGAREALGHGPVLVHNGDILADVDVARLLEPVAFATLAVCGEHPVGEGTVGLSADGAVVRLRGQRFGDEVRGADFVGVQVVGEAARRVLPQEGCLVGDVYIPALSRGERIRAVAAVRSFRDVGTLSAYGEANLAWLGQRGHGETGAWVGEGAEVADTVSLRRSLIGAGARVTGVGTLEDCIVWPGARVAAPLKGMVVTTAGRRAPWRA
jgi:mannose-1-phosphate guanylyltransferase